MPARNYSSAGKGVLHVRISDYTITVPKTGGLRITYKERTAATLNDDTIADTDGAAELVFLQVSPEAMTTPVPRITNARNGATNGQITPQQVLEALMSLCRPDQVARDAAADAPPPAP